MIEMSKHLGYPDNALVAAVKTLEDLGYVYCGGDRWIAPPNNNKGREFVKLVERLESDIADVIADLECLNFDDLKEYA